MNVDHAVRENPGSRVWRWLDRHFGRGSYYWLKDRIDPKREYTQLTYARLIDNALTPQTRWLDAGGGHKILETSTSEIELAMVRRVRLVACCDRVVDAIAKHRSISLSVGATLDRLPFRSESIDLITLNNVAEHVERPREVLTEFARVLVPGGRVIIHTPNISSYAMNIVGLGRRILPKPFILKMIRFLDFREEEDVFPTYYRANTVRDLKAIAAQAGLSGEKVQLVPARPLFYFVAPLCAAELAISRLLLRLGAEQFAASVILAVFRKPS